MKMTNSDDNYVIMNALLEHVEVAKEGDPSLSLTDIILDFSDTYNISSQRISEIIAEDSYFKKILLNDCISRNIIRVDKKTDSLDDW